MARDVKKLLKARRGLILDISFGGKPQARSVTLSPHGDIRHDPRKTPLPIPTASVHTAVVTHVLEYLDPVTFYDWFDELHRIMLPDGLAYFSGPYGGDESWGWLSDPTHRVRVVEQTFAWLDPRLPFYEKHTECPRKKPKPWLTEGIARVPGAHGTYSYNAALRVAQP